MSDFSTIVDGLQKSVGIRAIVNQIVDALKALDTSALTPDSIEQLIRENTDTYLLWESAGDATALYSTPTGFTWNIAELVDGAPVIFETNQLANVQNGKIYYVRDLAGTSGNYTFNLATDVGGDALDISDSGEGAQHTAAKARIKEDVVDLIIEGLAPEQIVDEYPGRPIAVITRQENVNKTIILGSEENGGFTHWIEIHGDDWKNGDTFSVILTGGIIQGADIFTYPPRFIRFTHSLSNDESQEVVSSFNAAGGTISIDWPWLTAGKLTFVFDAFFGSGSGGSWSFYHEAGCTVRVEAESAEATTPTGTNVRDWTPARLAELVDARALLQSQKGQPNGVAELGSNGKVPAAQLPAALTFWMSIRTSLHSRQQAKTT
jgi:hypothetical protein